VLAQGDPHHGEHESSHGGHDTPKQEDLVNQAPDDHASDDHASDDHAPDDHASDAHASDAHASDAHASDHHASDDHVSYDQYADAHASDAHASDAHASEDHASDHHGESHGSESGGSSAASVAVGLFSTTILIPFVFTLIQQGGVVTELMWQFIDMFVSVFLAILWFGAFSEILTLDVVYEFLRVDPVVMAVVQVFVLYFLALVIAYLFRDNMFRLVTFGSCGAHYVAFAGIAAGEHTQRTHFSDQTVDAFIFAAIAFAVIGAVFFSVYRARRQLDGKLNHVIDEIEIDVAALVTSYLVTQAIRMWLRDGEYPPPHLLLLAGLPAAPPASFLSSSFGGHGPQHTFLQRSVMLIWAVFIITMSIVVVPRIQKWGHQGVWRHKLGHFVKVLMIMCGSWGFLLWGEWEFHAIFRGDELFGKMVFALIATMTCLFILMGIGYLMGGDREHIAAAKIGMTGLGLVAAWSWEHCFHVALDVVGEEYQVGYGGLIPKLVLAILVPCFVLPVYVNYVKPIVLDYEHKDEEEEEKIA
jgi:hypothetical protein